MSVSKQKTILAILYIVSTITMLLGLGYTKDWSNYNFVIASFIIFCYLFSTGNRITLILVLVSFSIISFYFPTGFIYGKPTAEIIGPLLQTNKFEIIGYVKAMKYGIVFSCLFIVIQFGIYHLNKNNLNKKNYILPFLIFYSLSLYGASINGFQLNDKAPLKNSISAYKSIQKQKEEQKKYIKNSENVTISMLDESDDTEIRVIIIGESVRKDYMSIFGYQYNTTPYLNSTNGIFIDGLVSVAPNTEQSLNRTLFKTNPAEDKIDWGVNVVSLANKANYETYWISNQGRSEHGDNILFDLAKLANANYFLKEGNFLSNDKDDDEMLPIFQEVINSNSNHKVIFIHMIGSHEPICSRLGSFKPSFDLSSEASCYVASIEKLDLFISKITSALKNRKYKLMYFSDHGLSVDHKKVFHDVDLNEEYQVPFFYLDSESKKQQSINKTISGLNLLDFYASFINIKTNVTDEKYNFDTITELKNNPDPIVFWQEYKHISDIKNKQLPIIDIGVNHLVLNKPIIIKNNFSFSDECISMIDEITPAFPYSPMHKIQGWAAASQDKKPLSGTVGTFIDDDGKFLFIEGESSERNDVRNHFLQGDSQTNTYGVEVIVDKKYLKGQKGKIFLGYKNKNNQYIACKNS